MHNHHRLMFAAAAAGVVLAVVGIPFLAYSPLLAILVLCPLVMHFMIRDMGHGSDQRDDASTAHRH